MSQSVDVADLMATLKVVALFAFLITAIAVGLLFGLNYHNFAKEQAYGYRSDEKRK